MLPIGSRCSFFGKAERFVFCFLFFFFLIRLVAVSVELCRYVARPDWRLNSKKQSVSMQPIGELQLLTASNGPHSFHPLQYNVRVWGQYLPGRPESINSGRSSSAGFSSSMHRWCAFCLCRDCSVAFLHSYRAADPSQLKNIQHRQLANTIKLIALLMRYSYVVSTRRYNRSSVPSFLNSPRRHPSLIIIIIIITSSPWHHWSLVLCRNNVNLRIGRKW